MAKKQQLRRLRSGTVINATSKKQETEVIRALDRVVETLRSRYPRVTMSHCPKWDLSDIVKRLEKHFPGVGFHCFFPTSHIRPDGGFLSLVDQRGEIYPVLISEVKNQGTNDIRMAEGKKKQSKGNAIERLGKNVIGLRAAFRTETIFPFVCFGYGCDFEPDSSILDRVVTIAMFGELCKTNLHDEGQHGYFDRGSYYFRAEKWSVDEMYEVMLDIAERSLLYYFSKYGRVMFEQGAPPV